MGYFLMMNRMFYDIATAKEVLQKSEELKEWKIRVWGVDKFMISGFHLVEATICAEWFRSNYSLFLF